MSVLCNVCGTRWVLKDKKCPKCGAGANGERPSSSFGSTEQTNPDPEPTPAPLVPDTGYVSGGGGDFSGGGGGSDF